MAKIAAVLLIVLAFCTCNFTTTPDQAENQPDNLPENSGNAVDYSVEDAGALEALKAVDYNSSGNLANFTAIRCDAPVEAIPGASISVYVEAENNGTVTSSAVCYVYMSSNQVISTIDTYLGTISLGSLANGVFGKNTASLTIPAATMFGTYFIGFIVDRDNSVTETKEYDNILEPALLPVINIGKPNLCIGTVTAPATTNADYYLTFTITNNGNLGAAPFNMRIFCSNPADSYYLVDLIGITGEYTSNTYAYGIAPGQTVSITYYCEHDYRVISIGAQLSLSPGTYPLLIQLDTGSALNESNEFDNQYIGQITVE